MSASNQTEFMTFKDMILSIWRLKVGILIGLVLGLITGIVLITASTPKYEASMMIAANEEDQDGLKSLVSQTLPTNLISDFFRRSLPSEDSTFEVFEQTLTAAHLAEKLSYDEAFLKKIFYQRWDETNNTWQVETGFDEGLKALFLGYVAPQKPDAAALKKKLTKEIQIAPVGLTDFKRVLFRHPDAKFAQTLLETLFRESNDIIRKKALQEAEIRIAYLEDQLSRIRNAEHRDVLTSLLKEQERTRLMSSLDIPFAAKLVEPVYVTSEPVSPKVTLLLLTCMICGAVLGGFVAALLKKS